MNSEKFLDLTGGGLGLLKSKIPVLIGRDLIQQKKYKPVTLYNSGVNIRGRDFEG